MATVIALDLIQSAMRLIGALEAEETATAAEASDALAVLNDLLEDWSTENLTVFTTVKQGPFALAPGVATYTIGPAGAFNGFRPITIETAFVSFQGIDYPVQQVQDQQYDSLALKTQGSPIPLWLRYRPQFPLGEITLWPVPSDNAATLSLACNQQFSVLLNTAALISYPPGYSKALRYALAIELAPEYGKAVRPELAQLAQDAKADIKRVNKTPPLMSFDPTLNDQFGAGLGNFLGGV